ncbi:MAG: hypothetical protein JNK12_01660 [Acidimicrobiales bacterium]|nr:hypothetical protein [Acidimicrobiales bacterium]
MPRSSVPRLVAVPGEPVVVVPDAGDHVRTDALLTLVSWLAEARGAPPTVVCWQTGERVAEFRRVAAVLDAGAINEAVPARALAAARLTPLARAWKSRRLRRLLAPLADADLLVLGGADTVALLEWLPPRAGREVAVWLGDDDAPLVDRAVSAGSSFLVAGDRVAAALVAQGAAPARLLRVGEPLVAGPEGDDDADRPSSPAGPGRIAVVGAGPGDDDALPGLVAAVLAGATLPPPAVAWVRGDGDPAARWADDRYAGFEHEVVDWTPQHARDHLDEVVALVVVGPADRLLVAEAAVRGVPVLAGLPVGIRGAVEATDAEGLHDLLTAVVTDPTATTALVDRSREAARPHLVDQAGRATLAALGIPR